MSLPVIAAVPLELSQKAREMGQLWANSPHRPRIAPQIEEAWGTIVAEWAESDLPLAIRKGSDIRGKEVMHQSGRRLVTSDNSVAQWAFCRAYAGETFSVDDIRSLLEEDRIPFAFASKSKEIPERRYLCNIQMQDYLGGFGWRLCHIEPVGLNQKRRLAEIPIEDLKKHFIALLDPRNHFLVPKVWGGFGELPEVIDEVRRVDGRDGA